MYVYVCMLYVSCAYPLTRILAANIRATKNMHKIRSHRRTCIQTNTCKYKHNITHTYTYALIYVYVCGSINQINLRIHASCMHIHTTNRYLTCNTYTIQICMYLYVSYCI